MLREFYKKVWHKYLFPKRLYTVFLRGRIGEDRLKELQNSRFYLKNKDFLKLLATNKKEKVVLEIGFGAGQHLIGQAKNNPEKVFIGVELFVGGIYKILSAGKELGLTNLYAVNADARDFINAAPPRTFSVINILFPDPWPKKKHFKRRLLKYEFIKSILPKLEHDGTLFIATDIESYKEEILENLQKLAKENFLKFEVINNGTKFLEVSNTQFAKRAIRQGRSNTLFKITHH